jgi:hypothetical protein
MPRGRPKKKKVEEPEVEEIKVGIKQEQDIEKPKEEEKKIPTKRRRVSFRI